MPKPAPDFLSTEEASLFDADYLSVAFDSSSFVDNASFGVYRMTMDGQPLSANRALAELNGYSSVDELLAAVGSIANEWYVDPTRRQHFLRILAHQGRVENLESEVYRHKTRERIWVSEDGWLVRDTHGKPLYYEGTIKDITARKEHELFQTSLAAMIEETLRLGPGEAFYQALLKRAVQSIPGAQAGSILLFDTRLGRYRYVATVGFDLGSLSTISFSPADMPRKHRARTPFVVLPKTVKPPFGGDYLGTLETHGRLHDIQSTLNIPIVLGEQPLAIINLDNFERNDAFGDTSLQLADSLSKQLVNVLSRFQLESVIQQRQEVSEQSANFHHSLVEFMSASLRQGQGEDFYARLLGEAVNVVPGAQAGSILLKKGERFQFVATEGFESKELAKVSFSLEELQGFSEDPQGLSREPYRLIPRETPIVHDPERRAILDTAGRVTAIKISLAIPISKSGEVVAFLFLDNFENKEAFSDTAIAMSRVFAEQIGVLLSRFELERSLGDKQQDLAVWGEFHQGLTQLMSDSLQQGLDENFYQRLLERAVTVVPGAQMGSIMLRSDSQSYKFVASAGFNLQDLQTIVIQEKDLFFDIQNRSPQLIQQYHSYQASSEATQQVLETSGKLYDIAVTLAIPIWLDNTLAALLFLDNLEDAAAFHPDAIQMAEGFAKQVGILLKRLSLEQELKHRQEALERWEKFRSSLILFISETLKRGLDERFYQRLLEHAASVIPGAEAGAIMTLRDDGRYAFVAAIGHDLQILREVSFAPHEVFAIHKHPKAQVINQVSEKNLNILEAQRSDTLRRASYGRVVESLLAVPVILEGVVVATLSLDAYQDNAFSLEALEMAGAFGTQVALLLQRLKLEQELQERQQALARWGSFHSSLIQFSNEALRRGETTTFYQDILEHAASVIPGVEAGSILQRDAQGSYRFVSALNFDLVDLQRITLSSEELYYNRTLRPDASHTDVYQDDNVYLNNNVSFAHEKSYSRQLLEPEHLKILQESGRIYDIGSSLSAAVTVDGVVIAVLNLNAFRRHAFSLEAKNMAQAYAAQIAVLLQRLNLERELEKSNLELAKLANYDALTGLPNRALFTDRLEQAIAKGHRQNSYSALLFLDLDGFKLINDSLGHSVGDELLKNVAERLLACVRDDDTVARLGGDEFTIILNALKAPHDTIYVAEKVLHILSKPFHLDGRELHIGASMGITVYPNDGGNVEELVQHADTAMYHAKALGKNRYHFFTSELNAKATEQLRLENDMRRGLPQGEFRLVYQPRVQLRTNEVTSLEALARWHHPELGQISSGVFISIAEKSSLIQLLGREVLRQACQQAKDWQARGHFLRVAVNVSVKQLQQDTLVEDVQKVLSETGLEARWLELEITESAAMTDVESNIGILNTLRHMGVYISVDDFGTAYSSLNYLKRLPVNSLKIDKSFVEDISDTESADTAIVQAVIALGKSLGFSLIAEGVEDKQQLSFLRGAGCDEAQGYWFSKPMSAADTFEWIKAQSFLKRN
jgi:diguanylate cyclase (GGDEF)-like protein/PAS domain S-box-containing protein